MGIKADALRELVEGSCFWAAALGSHYVGVLASVLDYIQLPCVDVTVLADRDKRGDSRVYRVLEESPMVRKLEIFWNQHGHDFGQLPINPIKTNYEKPKGFNRFRQKPKQSGFR